MRPLGATMAERHFWDTCCWIDFVNEDGPKAPMHTLFTAVTKGSVALVFSPVIMAELLLQEPGASRPWLDPHPTDALFETEGLILIQIDRLIGERARSLRRAHKLSTPDALHLACALEHNVDMFITRDDGILLRLPPLLRRDGEELQIVPPASAIGGPLFGGTTI